MELVDKIFEIVVKVFAILGGYGALHYAVNFVKTRKEDKSMAETKEHNCKHVEIDKRLNQGDRKFDVLTTKIDNLDKKVDDKFDEMNKKIDLIVKLSDKR